jgi:hypothetical protein
MDEAITKHKLKYPMLINRYYLIFPLLLMIYSCGKKGEYSHELTNDPKTKFIIKLDSLTPANTTMMQFFDDCQTAGSQPILAMLNSEMQFINLHDYSGKKIKEINLAEIDSTFQKVSGFHFIDSDSLLLYSYANRQMHLVSCGKHFPKKLLFNLDSIKIPTINMLTIQTSTSTPIIYENGKIYLAGRANFNDLSKPQLTRVNTAFCVNIKDGKVDFLPVFESVWQERYWHYEQIFINHEIVPQQNTIIYSVRMKDSLVVYNINTKSQIKISMQSEELGNEKDMRPDIEDMFTLGTHDDLQDFLSRPRYGRLIFDKYRNIYYRFVAEGNTNRTTSIIICDNKFRKIGETVFPGRGLDDGGCFIAKEGLFLKDNNVKGEDKIIYTLFKFKKIV